MKYRFDTNAIVSFAIAIAGFGLGVLAQRASDHLAIQHKASDSSITLTADKGGNLSIILEGARECVQLQVVDGEASLVVFERDGKRACSVSIDGVRIIDEQGKADTWP